MYRKCLKQRLAHGKYPEMLAIITITTTTIILCYFPIQLRKEGDMDSKKCTRSSMRMLKFILLGRWRNQSPKGFCPRQTHCPLQRAWERGTGAHGLARALGGFQPLFTPSARRPVQSTAGTAGTERPYLKAPQQRGVSVTWTWPSSHCVTADIRWDSIWKVPLKFESRGCQHKLPWPPYSTLFQEAKRPETGLRRGWRTVLTLLFQNVCRWQKKIKLFFPCN